MNLAGIPIPVSQEKILGLRNLQKIHTQKPLQGQLGPEPWSPPVLWSLKLS